MAQTISLLTFVLLAAIFALGSAQPIAISFNQTVQGYVSPFNWTYYSLTLSNASAPAHIVIKCLKGDVFVFVAMDRLPTLTNYDWKDTSELTTKDIVIPANYSVR